MGTTERIATALQRSKVIKKLMIDAEWNSVDLAEATGLNVYTVRSLLKCQRTTFKHYDRMEQTIREHLSRKPHLTTNCQPAA